MMTMNNANKFRVLDTSSNTYATGNFYINENGELFFWKEGGNHMKLNQSVFKIERCTGRKDTDDNLIFHGDAVSVLSASGKHIKKVTSLNDVINPSVFYKILGSASTNPELMEVG